jgi:predicted unusual protein kinase regulating ubiquinone biosynthesis (AarF/ABC1/UbiB family)
MLRCVAENDTRGLVEILLELRVIIPGSTSTETIVEFFDYALSRITRNGIPSEVDVALIDELSKQKPFDVPVAFVFLSRSVALIEGICRKLDPQFDAVDYLQPIFTREVSSAFDFRQLAVSVVQMPTKINAISENVSSLRRQRAQLSNRVEKLQSNVRWISYATVGALVAFAIRDADLTLITTTVMLGFLRLKL